MTRGRGCVHAHGRVVRDGGDDDVWVCVFGYSAMGVAGWGEGARVGGCGVWVWLWLCGVKMWVWGVA